jgi:hypothetical protein
MLGRINSLIYSFKKDYLVLGIKEGRLGVCRILKISNVNSKLLKTLEIFLRGYMINCKYRYSLQFKLLYTFFYKKEV